MLVEILHQTGRHKEALQVLSQKRSHPEQREPPGS